MNEQRTEVIGTVRDPDGVPSAEIDGLVTSLVTSDQKLRVLSKQEAISWAQRGLLWCRAPDGTAPVEIDPIDRDGDGRYDYVQSRADHTRTNNLLRLRIWDRRRSVWLDWQGRTMAA